MKKRRKNSSESFASFTLSRIPKDIRKTFTKEQYSAIKQALIAQRKDSRHSIDIRFNVSFIFRHYYLVLLGGRDRRRNTYDKETTRFNFIPKPILSFIRFTALSMIGLLIFSIIFITLYNIKSYLGIDLIPGVHLRDLLLLK